MEKVSEEVRNLVEDTRSDEEDESIRETVPELVDSVDSIEEGITDPSNSHTVTFEDHDVNESDMEEDEKVLEFFRRNTGLKHEIAEQNNSPNLNMSEETEQASVVFHSSNDSNEIVNLGTANLNSPEIPEGIKSSSASDDDTDDSSSDSDLDSSLSRYYFDGSLPVSAHIEEPETFQDESHIPIDENKMPLLGLEQTALQQTSWRNCCGLLEILRAANP